MLILFAQISHAFSHMVTTKFYRSYFIGVRIGKLDIYNINCTIGFKLKGNKAVAEIGNRFTFLFDGRTVNGWLF